MKAEINEQNRRKFEALYINQDVLRTCSEPNYSGKLVYHKLGRPFSKYNWLELKPLSSISDEDAEIINLGSEDYNEAGWCDKYGDVYYWTYADVDYLRSKGYALPWMGVSIEEMIEAGWIKLITK